MRNYFSVACYSDGVTGLSTKRFIVFVAFSLQTLDVRVFYPLYSGFIT